MTGVTGIIRDLTDDEARRALPCKWGSVDADVLPSWVAEMDYAVAPPIADALAEAVAAGVTGYPDFVLGGPLGEAYAGFAERQFGHRIDPTAVIPVVDVTAGVRLALDVLSSPEPAVMTLPGYPPLISIAEVTGRKRLDLVVDPDADRAEFDLDQLDRLLDPAGGGARTLLLTNPHNPWGRVFTRAELEGIRDVVRRHGARVVSDEIHAPLVLEGAPGPHIPYLSLDGTARPRGRGGGRVQGVQHARPALCPDRGTRPGHPRPGPLRADGPQRFMVAAGRDRGDRGVHGVRRMARRAAGRGSAASATCWSACSPSSCPRRGCGRWRRRTWPGSTCAPTATTTRAVVALERGRVRLAPGMTTTRASPDTCASTSPPAPSGSRDRGPAGQRHRRAVNPVNLVGARSYDRWVTDLGEATRPTGDARADGAMIRARGLRKTFEVKGAAPFEAVKGIDVDVERGEAFGFLGPNGAGKSSTMRMIGRVSPPSAGRSGPRTRPRDARPPIRSQLGVCPQRTRSTRS